jgi:hypothetical protein
MAPSGRKLYNLLLFFLLVSSGTLAVSWFIFVLHFGDEKLMFPSLHTSMFTLLGRNINRVN